MLGIFNFISRFMAVIVPVVAIIALFFPKTFNWIPATLISPLLGVVMFGMGLTLSLKDFKIIFSRPKDILIGFVAQFTIMPLLAFGLSKLFNLPDELAVGMILVGCCPGGTASNVMTFLAKGDVALSVGMTSVNTIFAPILTPLLTWLLAGKRIEVDVVNMFLSIVEIVILTIVAGILIHYFLPKFSYRVTKFLPGFSSLAILLILGIVVSMSSEKILTGSLLIILAVALHNICGLALGFLLAKLFKLDSKKRSAISIEVGMQNSGLAVSLAKAHFAMYPMATIPGAIFSVIHNLSGAIIARIYARMNKNV